MLSAAKDFNEGATHMVLGIYGAGGLGRELLILAQQINKKNAYWEEILFIDDNKYCDQLKNVRVINFDELLLTYTTDMLEITIGIGEPYIRKRLRDKVYGAGYRLATLIHPSVFITEDTVIGAGTIICSNSFISCEVKIGENVLIQPSVNIGHDNRIGSDIVISTNVCISGGCSIGDETYIGVQVPIKENVNIGKSSIIGMGSVVIRDIPDNVIAIGNPARAMKENIDHKVFSKKN